MGVGGPRGEDSSGLILNEQTKRRGLAGKMIQLNAIHDPALKSWVESANAPECDFPIQNLGFGECMRGASRTGKQGLV